MGSGKIIGVMVIVFSVWNGIVALGVDPDYYVSPNGDDAWNGEYATHQGGLNGPKATIQAGINVAGSGSSGSWKTIHVLNNEGQGCTYTVNNSSILLDQYDYQEIIFYEDVVVQAGSWFDTVSYKPLFKIDSVNNIRFTGYEGATFRMTKRAGYMTYNGCHAIRLDGCSNVEILGLTLEKSRGDGIIVRSGSPENITIKDVDCDDNCRNGISVISADGLTIEDCILRNTSGATEGPCAGIKIEPDHASDILKDIVVRDTTIRGNAGGTGGGVHPKQLGIGLGKLTGNPSEPVSITFEDILVTDGPGILVSTICDDGPTGSIVFRRVTVESTHCGADIRKSYKKANLSFEDCTFEETGSGYSPIEIRPRDGIAYPGGGGF